MVILSEEPPEKDEDDPEPKPDIVPNSRKNQLCQGTQEKKFCAAVVAVAEELGDLVTCQKNG
jgi:hypothetical protein